MEKKIARLILLWGMLLCFFALIIIACWEKKDIALAYCFAATGASIGLVLVILTTIGYIKQEACQEEKICKLYSGFIGAIRGASFNGLWGQGAIRNFKEFQEYFKHIYQKAEDIPTWPEEEPHSSTYKEAQEKVKESRKLHPGDKRYST